MAMRKIFKVVDNFKRIPLYKLPAFASELHAEKWIMESAEERLGPNLSLSITVSYVCN